jgi:hypothetical protein
MPEDWDELREEYEEDARCNCRIEVPVEPRKAAKPAMR